MDWDALYEAATEARGKAYAPYSRFPVGAAVLMDDGTIFSGCNVENRSFGLTICAERVALAAAVTSGRTGLRAVLVLTDTEPPSAPCGACREFLTEFGTADTSVMLTNTQGDRQLHRLLELHPFPFVLPSPEQDW